MYDYLIVGAGLYGSIFAHEAKKAGKSVLVIEKRGHIGGNIYTKEIEGIEVHQYGAHIFHTNEKKVWDYLQQFASFNRFTNSPLANYQNKLYSLPFNMHTFYQMWGTLTPQEAKQKIKEQQSQGQTKKPSNLEEQAMALVGRDIYEKLIKGYTKKQWGRACETLPPEIIKRLPVRFTFDTNYFEALYQGIPINGYTQMIANMLSGIEVRLEEDYLEKKNRYNQLAKKVVYTGPIDAYFDYALGCLEYRSLKFTQEILAVENFQGNAVINYTHEDIPWTRIIEHKWFTFGKDKEGKELSKTVISKEYSLEWNKEVEPYYPINDEKNIRRYQEYKTLAEQEDKVIFGGRLGEYKYYDMDMVILNVLKVCERELF